LENKRSEDDKMSRRIWKAVKTEVGKTMIAKAERERKEKRRKRKGEKTKEVKKD